MSNHALPKKGLLHNYKYLFYLWTTITAPATATTTTKLLEMLHQSLNQNDNVFYQPSALLWIQRIINLGQLWSLLLSSRSWSSNKKSCCNKTFHGKWIIIQLHAFFRCCCCCCCCNTQLIALKTSLFILLCGCQSDMCVTKQSLISSAKK